MLYYLRFLGRSLKNRKVDLRKYNNRQTDQGGKLYF